MCFLSGTRCTYHFEKVKYNKYLISLTRFEYKFGFLGGPLVVQKSFTDDTAVIYGVISHGYSCASKNVPGINTRVTRYVDWIKKRMLLPTITTTTTRCKF